MIDVNLSVEGRSAVHSHGSFAFSENVNINCGLQLKLRRVRK